MKLYKVLLLFVLTMNLKAECSQGCLSCSDDGLCILCDFQYGFVVHPKYGYCYQQKIPYCQTYDLNGNCLRCESGFYTEPNSQKCLEIPRQIYDSNCAIYNSSQQCEQCVDGYYPIANRCQEVASQIENCLTYGSSQHCLQCKDGYIPNLLQTNCVQTPTVSNCQTFTGIKCSKCLNNSSKVHDFLKSQIKLEINQKNIKTLDTIILETQSKHVLAEDSCLFSKIENCLQYSGFNICALCDKGYFLSEGLCIESPKEIIPNCQDYLNESSCKSCIQGYYLFNQNTCKQILDDEKIGFCAEYSTTQNQPVCLTCVNTHYLSNQTCQERQSFVDKCIEYYIEQDKCKQCYSEDIIRVITSDGKKCLPSINYCSVYEISSITSNQLECNTCQQGYYLNSVTLECIQGIIQNCKIYKRTQNECEICQNNFYLKDNICYKHIDIQNCEIYDPIIKDSCQKCVNKSIKMQQNNTCIKVNITGCQEYASENQCQVCQDGYNLSTDKQCVLLSSSSHCLRAVNNICVKCVSGYFLKDQQCFQIFDYELKNCFSSNQQGQQGLHLSQECDVCIDNAVPYNLKDSYVCLKASELTSIFNEPKFFINNCSVYKNDNNSIKCSKCNRGFILSNNSCVPNCGQNQNMQFFKFVISNNKLTYTENTECINLNTGVESTTLDKDYQTTPFKLLNTHQYRMYYNRLTEDYKIIEPSLLPGHPLSQDLYKLPMHREIVQVRSIDKVENCEFYEWFHDDVYYCQTCQFGFFGEITNYARKIDNCNQYEPDDTCKFCMHKYKRNTSKTQCNLSEIQYCEQYEINTAICLTCKEGYYRTSLQQCQPNTVNNCLYSNKFSNTCIQCELYYILSSNKQTCYKEIDNCYIHTETSGTMTCTECHLGFYPNTTKTACLKGNIDLCIQYDQTQQNTCKYYYNVLKAYYNKQCQPIPKRYGCKEYSTNFQSCSYCQKNKYYYSREAKCCDPGTYPANSNNVSQPCQNKDTNNPQCKIWTYNTTSNTYQCSECFENYHLSGGTQCCHYSEYYDQNQCKKLITYNDSNTLLCTLFDINERMCYSCTNGNYVNKNKCCPNGKYNNSGTCDNISIANCKRITDDLQTCLECNNNYTLKNNICCNTSTHIFHLNDNNQNICLTKPTNMNCKTYQSSYVNGAAVLKCSECTDNTFYMINNNIGCCKKGTSSVIAQIWDATANSNAGGCIDVPTADRITGCQIYDSSKNCISCQEDQTPAYYLQHNGKCCQQNLNHDGADCIQTSRVYDNCLQINKSNTSYCSTCQDGYYISNGICVKYKQFFQKTLTNQNLANIIVADITTVDNAFSDQCTKMSDDKAKCIECAKGYYLPSNNTKLCCKDDQYFANNVCINKSNLDNNNCIYFDTTGNKCAKSTTASIFNFGFCQADFETYYYIVGTSSNKCCQLGQRDNGSGSCIANMTNCLVQDSTNCLQCKDGYKNLTSSCPQLSSNCLESNNDNSKCIQCKDGLYVKTTVGNCVNYTALALTFPTSQNCMGVTENTTDVNQSVCVSCQKGYYLTNDHCCQFNQYFTSNTCTSYSNTNCALITDNGGTQSCNKCFIDTQHCYNYSQLEYIYKPSANSIYFQQSSQDVPIGFKEKFEIQENTCCQKGTYLNGSNNCVSIPQDSNCQYGIEDTGTFKCKICNDGYYSITGKCCLVTQVLNGQNCVNDTDNKNCEDRFYDTTLSNDNDKLYLSNSKCCRQNFYHDNQTQKCEPHPDTNCLKSNSKDNCLTCKSITLNTKTYSMKPSDFYISSELILKGNKDCQDDSQIYYFKPCVLDTNTTDNTPVNTAITSNNKMSNILVKKNNCKLDAQFNCTECYDGYYIKDGYCCSFDEFHRDGQCIQKSIALQYCVNFDPFTFKCNKCQSGYTLSQNQCCQNGYTFNILSMQCEQIPQYCKDYKVVQKYCNECVDGSYMQNGKCCPYGTYYDFNNDSCLQFTLEGMTSCKQGTYDSCTQCYQYNTFNNDKVYINLTNNKCCSDGQYYDNSTKQCKAITSQANCASVSDSDQCTKCLDGYYLDNVSFKCCQYGYLWVTGSSKCLFKELNCIQTYWDGNQSKCSQCEDNFYLTNQHCCEQDYYYNTTSNKCVKLYHKTLVNCKIPKEKSINGTLYCSECNTGFQLTDQVVLNSTDFTLQEKTVCCASNQVWDPIQSKCVDVSTLTTNDYMPTNISDCSMVYSIIVSNVVHPFCMKCGNSKVLEILEQSSNFDSFNTSTKKVACQTAADQHNNCNVVYMDALGSTNVNKGCLSCTNQTDYKPDTTAIRCCTKGVGNTIGEFYNQDNDTCATATVTNCVEYNPGTTDDGQCLVCQDTYFVDPTTTIQNQCIAETPNDTTTYCLQKQNGGTCQQCVQSYYLNDSFNCVQVTSTDIINITGCSGNSSLQCIRCFGSQYLSEGGCCDQLKFFDPISQTCQNIQNFENCNKYSNNLCIQCDNNQYYPDSGRCCPLDTKFQTTQCVNITFTGTDLQPCSKVNQNGDCIQCKVTSNNYISNGRCCQQGKYYNGTDCIDINTTNYPDCNQFQTSCTNCSTSSLQNNNCCGNRYWNGFQCQSIFDNCIKMNINGTCQQCQQDYYLTDNHCCRNGSVYLNNTCTTILSSSLNTHTNCIQISKPTASSVQCDLCKEDYHLTNGKCCLLNQYYDTVSNTCISYDFINNCTHLSQNHICIKCNEGYYLSSNKCCKEGTYYNTTNKKCEDISDQSCLQKDGTNRCSKCINGFYINPVSTNTNECCRYGMSSTNTSCQNNFSQPDIPNCILFNTSGNCTKCQDNFNLSNNVCCPSGHIILDNGNTQDKCIHIDDLYNNCLSFDTLTLKCKTCKQNFYILDQNDQHICCPHYKHYEVNKGCVDNYEGCKLQQIHDCLECQLDTDYLSGVTGKKRCCPKGQYADYSGTTYQQCIDINIHGCAKAHLDNSNKLICDECYQGNLQKGNCCQNGSIFDVTKNSCVDPIENCKLYQYNNSNQIECKECQDGFDFTDSKQQCCAINQFFDGQKKRCMKNIQILDTKCQTIDKDTYQCTSCQVQHYLQSGICCQYGKYLKNSDTKECTGVITTDYSSSTNCIAHDKTNCLKCDDGYELNSTKKCVQIYSNCSDFNVETPTCNSCDQNYYITEGHCCQQGQKYVTNSCVIPSGSISNCLKYNDGQQIQCTLCKQDYYLASSTICCPYGKYCTTNAQTNGLIKYCREYGSSTSNCLKCKENYSLVKIANSNGNAKVDYCMPYAQDNCWNSSISQKATSDTYNKLQCDQCQDFFIYNTVTSQTLTLVHPKPLNCLVTMTTNLFESSTLECIECEQDYYLNGTVCTQRTSAKLVNCRQSQKNQDACKECIFGYNVINGQCQSQVTANCQLSLTSQDSSCNVCKSNKIETGSNTNGSSTSYTCTARSNLENYNTEVGPALLDQGLINRCEVHHQCTDKYLNGLDPEISKFLSCHVCNDQTRIPFISIKLGYTNLNSNQYDIGILQYDYHNNTQIGQYNSERRNHSSECLKSDLSEIQFQGNVDRNLFPTNCAIGMINPSETNTSLNQVNATTVNLNTSKLSIFCTACKPGYKPINSNIKFHVAQCQQIQNCKISGTSFNECDQCEDNYAFNYIPNQGIDRSTCIQITTSQVNCYAFDQTNSICKACMKGYQINLEGFCELLNIPYCEQGKNNKLQQFEIYDWQLAYYKGDKGCQKCQQGFYRFLRQVDDFVCIQSDYAKNNKFLTENPILIKDCLKYQQTAQGLKCYQCTNNTILDINNICVPIIENLKHCLIAATPGSCQQCPDDLVLVSPKCVPKTIEFCQTYFNDKTVLTCKQCKDGYYLQDNECYQGLFENCAIYQNANICQLCYKGYELITTSLDKKKCIQVSINSNCNDFDNDKFQDMKIECTQCSFNHILKDLTIPQKVCNSLPEIDGCEIYDKGINYQSSTLTCNQCKDDYYIQDKLCYKRQREILNCYQYEISKDICYECLPGYYVTNQGLECEPQPIGIYGCSVYLNLTQCSICKSSYYLSDNKCQLVPEENIIQQCIQYNSDLSCMKCEQSYVLLENTCVQPQVQNCLEFIAVDSCSKCNYNFKIQENEEKKNTCVEIQILENCEMMQQVEPYGCEKCKAGHYFNQENQKCEIVQADRQIKNCLEYTQDFNCKLCQDDYALSVTKRQCIEFKYDSNCEYFEELAEPICVGCKQGYSINGEYKCVEDTSNKIPNCLVTRLNNNEQCGVCMPGYYMDYESNCIHGKYDEDKTQVDNNDNDTKVELNGQPLLLLMLCELIILIILY